MWCDCLLREVERRGTLSRDWTTGVNENDSDLVICFGEAFFVCSKKKKIQEKRRWVVAVHCLFGVRKALHTEVAE